MDSITTHFAKSHNSRVYRIVTIFLSFFVTTLFAHAGEAVAHTGNACAPEARTLAEYYSIGATASEANDASFDNHCPMANAGFDLPIMVDQSVSLDARNSTDIDGQQLLFAWKTVKAPNGSHARPREPNSIKTEFVPDLAGDYVFELSVTDSLGAVSTDTVTFSTANILPVANAGADLTAAVGTLVQFDATHSYDLNQDSLNYRWSVIDKPGNSRSTLAASGSALTSLQIDAEGEYVVQLVVHDGKSASTTDTVRINTLNSQPVAHAGRVRTMAANSTLVLDSEKSSDVDNDALAYHWSFLSGPKDYQFEIDDRHTAAAQVELGSEGLYLFQLMVDDGMWLSAPTTVLVEVRNNRVADFDLRNYLPLTNLGGGDDTDGDGILDPVDNCVLVMNAPQRDTDGDGIGNFCDGDFNNDGIINFADFSFWTPLFQSSDPDADMDGSGSVNFGDYALLVSYFLEAPGPVGTTVWISLVDGDWSERLNWQPAIVPAAGTTAIIDVAPAVTVTHLGTSDTTVKNLVQNESLVFLSGSDFEATGAVELGGSITATATTINNTSFVPSLASRENPSRAGGGGNIVLNTGTHTWSANTLGVNTTLNNGAIVNNSNGLTVNAITLIDAPSSPTGFHFINDQTVGGSGNIVFDGVGNSQISEPRLFPLNFTTLTLAPGLTISGGKGTIGQPSGNLILNANVTANVGSEVIAIGGTVWSSTGTLSAQNGGGLQMYGNFDNAGGTVNFDTTGGSINLLAGAALRNSVINGAAGTNMTINTGATTLENLIYNADFNMVNGALSNVLVGFTLNGNAFIDAPSSPTGLQFNGTQTLSGTGVITLDGVGNSQISEPRLFPFNFTTLTVDSGITIRGGKARIGQPSATLVLHGDVIADVSGETLLIAGTTWSSDASLTAINGGELNFSGNFNNGGSAVALDTAGGAVHLLAGASLRNATVNGTAGTNLVINTGATTLEAMQFTNDITMVNGAISNVSGGLTINGDVLIDAPSSPTGLQFTETQTLGGTTTIVLDGTGNSFSSEARLFPFNFTTLTIGADVTVRGGNATIGQASGNLIMLGDVIAEDAAEEILIGGTSWSANNDLRAINGGMLRMFGNMDNSGSAVNVDTAGGEFELLSGATLTNATFNGTPGTDLLMRTGATTLTAMAFNHDISYQNGALSNVAGGLTLNGNANIVAPSSPTGMQFTETQSLMGNASIVFDSAANSVISEPRLFPFNFTTLTIDSTISISGGKATIGQPSGNLVMNGSINADVAGQPLQIVGSLWSGTGTIAASNGGVIQLRGNLDNGNQALNFDTGGGSMDMIAGSAMRNASLVGAAGTTFGFNTGSHTIENLTVTADMSMSNGAVASVTSGLTLNGTATINAPSSPTGFQFTNDQTLGGAATIVINGAGNSQISEPRMLPLNFTTLTLAQTVTVRGGNGTIGQNNATTINNGTISADVDTLNVIGMDNNGLLEAINDQNMNLSVFVSNAGGDIHAGAGSTVNIANTVILDATSDLLVDISGPLVIGRIVFAAAAVANYGGALTISAVDGYSPNLGDAFAVIQHNNFGSTFDTVNSVGLGGGQSFGLTYNALDVTATVN